MDQNSTNPSPPAAIPTTPPIAPVTAVFIIIGITAGAILLHLILTFIFKRIVKKTIWQFDDDIVKYCQKPTFVMFPTIALLITIQLLSLPVGVYGTLNHALVIILLFTVSYFVVMLIKCGSMAVGRRNTEMKNSAPKRAREVETQIVVMTRIIQGMVWMLGFAGIAMTFPNAWQVGLSLLASASVSALLLGFAAKSSIENALASLTIALTQPFLLEDQVMVDGEVGHVEEIQSQYVIVRTLDERRLVVPLTWFLGNIFQNWSRNSPQQISECKVFVDYTFSVPRIRQAFLKFARAHPMFDGRHCALLVTDCTDKTIELTCQISVRNAVNVIQITSDVREAMVEFIAKGHQQQAEVTPEGTQSRMTMSDRGSEGYGCGFSLSTPPPLTEEDEKMGGGSKVYHQTCLKEKMGVPESVALALETSAVHNASSSDHIKVTVENPTPNSNRNTLDRDTGQPDTVVSQLRMSETQLSEK